MADVPQLAFVVDTEQQRADHARAAARSFFPATDDDLLLLDVLDLDPVAALVRVVRRVQRLSDDSFQPLGDALSQYLSRAAPVPRGSAHRIRVQAEPGEPV